ncbi:hypothetical protein BGZ61DRAFT_524413 [Ilyonectria robusta]|uniref:uncharacterized protein n=1 Tax=Ilyonectria robusta TaxID=1079257 RepID=UPI001E8D2C3B|nr:uncharacterized protein BGZ61DRAFT_524413 [Ilyonectria robusta]KAH8652919.1 hypothetical protein BGZ61DRAFT_524413 [Ilyonectria robusta]
MATNPPIEPNVFTTTQTASGQAVFTEVKPKVFSSNLAVIYGSNSLPVDITDNADLEYHSSSPIELVPKQGCQVFTMRIAPGGKDAPISRLHRNLSIDIGILVAGSVEAVLDSGESRTLVVGDSLIQRATMHGWRNTSETETASMVIVAIPATENGGSVQSSEI